MPTQGDMSVWPPPLEQVMALWTQLADTLLKVLPVTAYPDQLLEYTTVRPSRLTGRVPGASRNRPPGWKELAGTARARAPALAPTGAATMIEPVVSTSPAI